MGFFDKLLGREGNDTTVTDFQTATAASAPVAVSDAGQLGQAPGAPFQMVVEDVFSITGRGTVVTGTIGSGTVSVGDRVTVATASGPGVCTVTGVEMFRKQVKTADAGSNVGLLLDRARREDVTRGAVISRQS